MEQSDSLLPHHAVALQLLRKQRITKVTFGCWSRLSTEGETAESYGKHSWQPRSGNIRGCYVVIPKWKKTSEIIQVCTCIAVCNCKTELDPYLQ